MVVRPDEPEHTTFAHLAQYLREGDVLVLNETRVIAARVLGKREGGGAAELLLLRPSSGRYDPHATRWLVLARPGRRLRTGAKVWFGHDGYAQVVAVNEDDGVREVAFSLNVPFETFLQRHGDMPLPPYIHNDSPQARERYQTIFARVPGSVAAPTASLHFTEEVFARIAERGVETARLVLDVGLGTFRPVQTQSLREHVMHSENFDIPRATVEAIARAKERGGRVVAAGTTVVRALEGSARKHGTVRAGEDATDIFITPGFPFTVVDAMITNFHLPQSTLLALVCAFSGYERIMSAYAVAVRERYRFFSFGDAMFLERASW